MDTAYFYLPGADRQGRALPDDALDVATRRSELVSLTAPIPVGWLLVAMSAPATGHGRLAPGERTMTSYVEVGGKGLSPREIAALAKSIPGPYGWEIHVEGIGAIPKLQNFGGRYEFVRREEVIQ